MAASQRPTTTTVSACTLETARGTHVFKIAGYSLHKGLGVGKFIRSTAFAVGGYDWCIRYFPDGASAEVSQEYFTVRLELLTTNAEVRAVYDLSLAIPGTTDLRSELVFSCARVFNSVSCTNWGPPEFKKRSELEASPLLRDDCIVIVCDITVIKETRVEETASAFKVQVPPSDLSDNLRKLLEAEEGADVTFKVEEVVFPAHKIVLATRSPVFKAQFYGPIRDERQWDIPIEDIQPAVFKALLHFIYTDSLPSMDDLDGDEHTEMVRHLLVAADRYGMERMKMMCEAMLCESLHVETVLTTLELAAQRHCSQLTDACVQFLTSSNRMDDVEASQGYVELKRSRPAVLVDMLEKVTKSRRIYYARPG